MGLFSHQEMQPQLRRKNIQFTVKHQQHKKTLVSDLGGILVSVFM